MIPYEFDFHVVNGSGIIFHAKLDDEMENYIITWQDEYGNGESEYTVNEVLNSLSKGKWRQGLI